MKKLVIAGAALALISAVPALAVDLPAATVTGISNVSRSETIEVVKAGVNCLFNWGFPVVANTDPVSTR